jgi:hypothetical protein
MLVQRDIVRPTPVFGTAQPPRGVSGALRRRAYTIPEHHARHWVMLILADRVDVVETWLGEHAPAATVTAVAGTVVLVAWLSRRR